MCGCCTVGDQTTTTFSCQCHDQIHIVEPHTKYQVYEDYNRSKKKSSSYISLERLCSPSWTCDAPRIPSKPHPEGEPCTWYRISIYKMIRVYERTGIGQEFFSSRPQHGIIENGISRSNRFVRAPSSRGGSNAPHPVLSVSHLDVNVDGGRGRQARSGQKNVLWAVYARAILGSWQMQSLNE